MSRLDSLIEETGDGTGQSSQTPTKGGDEFERLKKQIAKNLRDVRGQMKERDELIQRGATGTKTAVQLSNRIRQQISLAREDANKLHALQCKEAAKKGKASTQQVQEREEKVHLIFQHVEECEALDKRQYASKRTEARIELFSVSSGSSRAGSSAMGPVSRVPVSGTELPDIETQDGLRQLQVKDQRIDEELEQVAAGVQDLKSVALDIRDEVKVQSAMVDEITHKVDKANIHLGSINKKMKKTLQQTRSADRFILDFILLVILLGIIGYIISMFS